MNAAPRSDTRIMAVFCDFENVALGVRDVKIASFDIRKVLERLLLKGNIVVKKAYCNWERYAGLQAPDARGGLRADRDPARAPVRQELRRHPHGRGRARPLLHEGARGHLRGHQRRLGFLAAGREAAREQQDRDRLRRQALDLRPPDQRLRRVHLLRRPGARRSPRPRRAATEGREKAAAKSAPRRRTTAARKASTC